MKRRLLSTFAALCALAALGFSAAPARADVCGDIFDDCALTDGIIEWNLDQFDTYTMLDTATCQKITDSVLAQCQAAVKAAVKCWNGQFGFLPKTAKPACKTEGSGADSCNALYEAVAEDASSIVASVSAQELECCEERAAEFFESCRDGF